MSPQVQARYLTAFEGSTNLLETTTCSLLEDLGAVFEESRANPVTGRSEIDATVNQSVEYSLKVHWKPDATPPILTVFDVSLFTPVEPYMLDNQLAVPAANYFPELILVYNSFGRERSIRLFPLLLDFENVVRELIVAEMLDYFGPDWWDRVVVQADLNCEGRQTAEALKQDEMAGKLHNCLPMHWLYYLDLRRLREIIDKAEEVAEASERSAMPDPGSLSRGKRRAWEQQLAERLPFSRMLDNYDAVSIPSKISEIRELRNRIMHGRYLTQSNEQLIRIICEQYDRFLISPGYVGDFESRRLKQ
jgi:hypothetical protein